MEGEVFMNKILFDKNGHLTESALKVLKENSLKNDEFFSILEHISHCEKCSANFADSFNNNELTRIPLGFEEEVKSKITRKQKNNTQFFFYSLRVSIAACMALMIVFSGTLNFIANTRIKTMEIAPPNLSIINSINNGLGNFSNKIINMEVFNNENKKR